MNYRDDNYVRVRATWVWASHVGRLHVGQVAGHATRKQKYTNTTGVKICNGMISMAFRVYDPHTKAKPKTQLPKTIDQREPKRDLTPR